MKFTRVNLMVILASLVLAGSAYAYHSGGVAECDGCHTMHNSKDGTAMTRNALGVGVTNPYLLQGSDASSTCLNCHGESSTGGYHVADLVTAAGVAPANYTPGGDFGWLLKTYSWTVRGTPMTEEGETHGHNVVAIDDGLTAETRPGLALAPGGTYPSANLGCHSCHDPHGKSRYTDLAGTIFTPPATPNTNWSTLPIKSSGSYGGTSFQAPTATEAVGMYRLLGGIGWQPGSIAGAVAFINEPPIALAPSTYNRSEAATDTRVAYGSGMSEWCQNCHPAMHSDVVGAGLTKHPAGNAAVMSAQIAFNYNNYVASGDMSGVFGGAKPGPYSSLVPFEEHASRDDATFRSHAVNNGTQLGGPVAGTSGVMCLSCHRAHASGFGSMMRWNMEAEMMVVNSNWPGTDSPDSIASDPKWSMGRTVDEMQGSYYQRPATRFATYQRVLCNKCHSKD